MKKNRSILVSSLMILCVTLLCILWLASNNGSQNERLRVKSKNLKGIDISTQKEYNESYIIFADYPKLKNKQLSKQLKDITYREIKEFKVHYPENFEKSNKSYQRLEKYRSSKNILSLEFSMLKNELKSFMNNVVTIFKVNSQETSEESNSFYQTFEAHSFTKNIVGFNFTKEINNKTMAHPIESVITRNYNLKTGAPIHIKDILKNTSSLKYLSKYAYNKLSNENIYKENHEELNILKEGLRPKEDNYKNIVLDNQNIIVYFDPYQIGSHANPITYLVIPLNKLKGIIKEEYIPS